MRHLPKCLLLPAYVSLKDKAPTFNELRVHVFTVTGPSSLSVSFMNMVLTLENKHKWDHSTSLEIPGEETQSQWKILEGYKLRIKVLELGRGRRIADANPDRGQILQQSHKNIQPALMGNYSSHLCAGLNLHEIARCPGKGVAIRVGSLCLVPSTPLHPEASLVFPSLEDAKAQAHALTCRWIILQTMDGGEHSNAWT